MSPYLKVTNAYCVVHICCAVREMEIFCHQASRTHTLVEVGPEIGSHMSCEKLIKLVFPRTHCKKKKSDFTSNI